jgi:V/A-type H+-transporting ATPase subunit G/H
MEQTSLQSKQSAFAKATADKPTQSTDKPISTLGKIKQKEQEVKEKIEKAQKKAEDLIARAKATAQKTLKQAQELDDKEAGSILDQAKNTIAQIQAQAKNTIAQEIKKLEQIPDHKINQALDLVVAKLMSRHDFQA